jgi:hypothetical protein
MTVHSSYQFLKLFTREERMALRLIATTDLIAGDLIQLCSCGEPVDTGDQEVIDGMSYLVSQGYITPERAAEIMA